MMTDAIKCLFMFIGHLMCPFMKCLPMKAFLLIFKLSSLSVSPFTDIFLKTYSPIVHFAFFFFNIFSRTNFLILMKYNFYR